MMLNVHLVVALVAASFLSSIGVSAFAFSPSRRSSLLLQTQQRYCASAVQVSTPVPFTSLPLDINKKQRDSALFSQPQEDDSESGLSTPLDNPALTALDVVALTGFAAVGKASHAPDGSIDFAAVLTVAFPFISSWLVASPLTGVYKELESSGSGGGSVIKDSFLQTVKGWAIAIPLGCALRGVIKGYVPPAPFVIVTLIATLVILSTVRVVYALAVEQQK